MSDQQKIFLQSFLSRGILDTSEVKELLSGINVDCESKEAIIAFVVKANVAIAPFNLEIKRGVQEEDGKTFYCLVNTVETPVSKLSSTYSPNELELFKKLIELIVETDDGRIGSLAALSLTEKLDKRMGKEEAQNVLERLEKDKWIKKDDDGKLSLHVRSIVELEQYLKDVFPEFIKLCNLCAKVCFLGEICKNCGIKIHKKCAERLFKKQGDEKKCPARDCRVVWGQFNTS